MAFFTPNRYTLDSSTPLTRDSRVGYWARETTLFWESYAVPILKSCARAFLLAASKYSPPGKNGQMLGTTSIDPKYYYCRIIDLEKSKTDPNVRKRPRAEDYEWIKKGYKFKVVSNQYRPKFPGNRCLGYAKSLRTAKQIARIKNRGLMKYSWGTLLNNFSGKAIQQSKMSAKYFPDNVVGLYETELPPTFRLLAQKSPNITKYRWGAITINPTDVKNSKWELEGHNYKTDTNAFNGIAVRRGMNAALRQWKSAVNAMRAGSVKSLQRILKFQINQIMLKHK